MVNAYPYYQDPQTLNKVGKCLFDMWLGFLNLSNSFSFLNKAIQCYDIDRWNSNLKHDMKLIAKGN